MSSLLFSRHDNKLSLLNMTLIKENKMNKALNKIISREKLTFKAIKKKHNISRRTLKYRLKEIVLN